MATNPKPQRAVHRPITITIENVRPMPILRVLPHETQMTANLKGDRKSAELLISEINKQLEHGDFFAIEIEGVS